MHKGGITFLGVLYDRIKMLCDIKGVKPATMCRELNISPNMPTELKSGRKRGLNAENANKIANYFGVSVSYLLGDKEAPAAESDERTVIDLSGLDEEQIAIAQEFMSLPPQKRAALVEFAKTLESGE